MFQFHRFLTKENLNASNSCESGSVGNADFMPIHVRFGSATRRHNHGLRGPGREGGIYANANDGGWMGGQHWIPSFLDDGWRPTMEGYHATGCEAREYYRGLFSERIDRLDAVHRGGNDDRPRFHLAATTDAGMHWTVTHVNTSGLTPPEATLTGNGYMYFLDSVHGWINLSAASGSAFHPGAALATQDGGKTWNWVPMGSGSAGRIFFRTLKDGWIISPDRDELDVTHDGSKSWQEVSLQALPPHAAGVSGSGYDLPSFEDDLHGFLMASFPNLDQLVLFSTGDGGQTWERVRPLPRVEAAAIIVAHSTWIAASIPPHSRTLTLTTLSLNKASSQPVEVKADIGHIPDVHPPGADADYLDFIDDMHGWILAGELLSTSDGGATWTDITPPTAEVEHRPALTGPKLPGHIAAPSPISPQASGSSQPLSPGGQAAALGGQTALGFDRGAVLCAAYPTMTMT